MLPIYENARLKSKVNFAPIKILSGGKSPRKCIYIVAVQETAKHCAKFGWPPVSDVAAVTTEISWGAPNSPTDLSHLWAEVRHIVRTCGGHIAV